METKQVIVVRKDLNMRKGKLAAQVAHASMGAIMKYANDEDLAVVIKTPRGSAIYDWLNGSFTKVVVSVNSEKELLDLEEDCKTLDLRHCLITDSGRTEFGGVATKTCIAIGPCEVSEVNKVTKHLSLL